MDMRTIFPSKYLRGEDVPAPTLFVMGQVIMEAVQGEAKPVVYFHGHDKGLILNPTNNKKLIEMYGPESNAWTGKSIVLFPVMVDVRGEMKLGLRIRLPDPEESVRTPAPYVPQPLPKTREQIEDDEIPF
jgi:hypothetical protein